MNDIVYYEAVPSYKEFLERHLVPNQPAMFGPALTKDWNARKEWVIPNEQAMPRFKPNYAYLKSRFGNTRVQVAECNKRHFTDQERSEMTFAEFCQLWEANEGKKEKSGNYYLKDWHFVKAFPDEGAYEVPKVFKDDWLNEYWINHSEDDYRFSYMGGDGTFTPLHADVYRSYSWSSNICGIKKWTLFPPGQEDCFKDKLGNMVYDIRQVDPVQFPRFKDAKSIVIYQRDGESLFVPSGWFHQVENIGATISINHNWCNSTNILFTFNSLQSDYKEVKESIQDIRESVTSDEFMQECQKLLLMHSGWNWSLFLSILHHVATCYIKNCDYQPDVQWQMIKIENVLNDWQEDKDFVDFLKQDPSLYQKFNELQSVIKHGE
ncbi:hypothetical protein CU097_003477 [Rhizopus azygosporus]|uniref:JmjC domain-containing protein n=1 Tax=Rhizopus azygosporus TaxID=86630 RepID=A0A367JIM1_RHIAZ|nr:hypothetical protein CU097_003477 [Rhizopus azygosporus]